MKFSECCKAINNLLTQGPWKKLIARDFPNSQLSWEVSTKQTCASLFKQKTRCQNTEVKLQNKIEDLEDKLDKCTTTLKTKGQELDEILKPDLWLQLLKKHSPLFTDKKLLPLKMAMSMQISSMESLQD